ncbi:hypothetical protein CSKR_103187 [Clonorchis sinensis]|uniref:Uncharacterized protein n=1 Tax=Clonorchis sinensis TaxID=79923 RepID=A0A8T1LX14_CLOSI|nr:hypothetical protein CSKR_103187 [Clonorchis sinensis]
MTSHQSLNPHSESTKQIRLLSHESKTVELTLLLNDARMRAFHCQQEALTGSITRLHDCMVSKLCHSDCRMCRRSPSAWEHGLLSNCSYEYSPDYSNITFSVNWNFDLLPQEYKDGLSGYFLIWYINQQLNVGRTRCLVADGERPVDDGFEIERPPDEYIPREKLLLVTPFQDGLCDRFVGKTFNNNLFTVQSCSLATKTNVQVDGEVLGEYELILSDQGNSPAGPKTDYVFYLYEPNRPKSGCTFGGNWGKYVYPEEPEVPDIPYDYETYYE